MLFDQELNKQKKKKRFNIKGELHTSSYTCLANQSLYGAGVDPESVCQGEHR